jgi:hypothetical protein
MAAIATATVNAIDVKYEYLIQQMEWCVATPRYDYMYKEIGLSMGYELQFQDAAKWYQRSKLYYQEHHIHVEKQHVLFLQKWLEQHPMEQHLCEALTKELLLSDAAMNILYGKSPKYAHLDAMDVLLLTEVAMLPELIPSPEEVVNIQRDEESANPTYGLIKGLQGMYEVLKD